MSVGHLKLETFTTLCIKAESMEAIIGDNFA